jgi:hypothetical protein
MRKETAMAASWITALKIIPWGDVVQNAPAVLRSAKQLWSMVGRPAAPTAPDSLAGLRQELARLKEQANAAATLISSLAEQNARLVEAVDVLRVRTRVLIYACSALVVASIALAGFMLAG